MNVWGFGRATDLNALDPERSDDGVLYEYLRYFKYLEYNKDNFKITIV